MHLTRELYGISVVLLTSNYILFVTCLDYFFSEHVVQVWKTHSRGIIS